ncbi:MAG: ferrous iron transport protein B [Deltaproteobacteria bacterium]|nr:ferrous iron transport protein B [Deltaproteobacteria bacterium]
MSAEHSLPRIVLAGNPNCGKTTIFNALTGLNYKVANYPGVTVEKKEGKISFASGEQAVLVDLPGTYTLSGHSIDEAIASKALLGKLRSEPRPDLIISVIDASNLERNLYLTTQLLDLNVPVIAALNMKDLADKDGIDIKGELLAKELGIPVIALSANKGKGISQLREQAGKLLSRPGSAPKQYSWLPPSSEYRAACEELGKLELNGEGEIDSSLAVLLGSSLFSEASAPSNAESRNRLNTLRAQLEGSGIDPFSFEATSRYTWIHEIVKRSCVIQSEAQKRLYDRIDGVITHKIWGSLIFLLLMGAIFQSIFAWASYPMDAIDSATQSFGTMLGSLLPSGQLKSLVVDGIVAGVGAVIIFVPQIAILFFFLGLLEDSGYLSRAAFLMDKIMRKFGLQGRSFIPLLSSFACAIPGIMSTRSIPSFADRMTTILVAPLMSCSARLPVYTLLIAAFIPAGTVAGFLSLQGLVLFSMYLLGVLGAVAVAWLLKLSLLRGEPAIFVMEMPRFRAPSLRKVLQDVWDRVLIFLKSAGTVILACSIVLWFLASYPRGEVKESYAGQIGTAMEPLIEPLGFNWQIGVGILSSFAAREVFLSSLSTVYNLEQQDDEGDTLLHVLKEKRALGEFTLPTALSLMVFYVFACQCMSTLAVCRRETGSWWWVAFMFTYMTAMAYAASFVTYHAALHFFGT